MRAEKGKTRAKTLLRWVIAATAAAFVLLAAWRITVDWQSSSVQMDLRWVVLALAPAVAAAAFQMLGWKRLIEAFAGRRVPFFPAAAVYFDSQLARYTPGKVGLPAVRIAGASRLGVSGRVMGSTLLVEVASWAATGLGGGVCLVLLSGRGHLLVGGELWTLLSWLGGSIVAGAVIGVSILALVPRARFPERLLALLGTESGELGSRPLVPVSLPLFHALHWSSWALCGALLGLGLGVPLTSAPLLGALLCLAIVLGFLALLAPAGAGVREAVLAIGATPVLGASGGLALGLLARAASLAADIGVWALARLLLGLSARESQ